MVLCGLVMFFASIGMMPGLMAEESSTTYLLRATRVYPVSSAPIDNGQVLVRDGRIVAVGKSLEVPADARVLDVSGSLVPGLIDGGSTLAVRGSAAEEFIEMTPEIRVLDTLDLDDIYLHDALLAGVTTAAVGPGDRNVIGGLGTVIRTSPSSLEEAVVREDAFMAVCITNVATYGNRTMRRAAPYSIFHRQPTTRMGTVFLARRAFFEALQLPVEDDPGDLQLSKPEDGSLQQILTPLGKEALQQTIESRRTIRVRADDKQEILAALRIAEEFELSVVLEGCVEVVDVIPQIARLKVDVLIAPGAHMSFYGDKHPNQVHDLARRLEAADVRFAFFSDIGRIVPFVRELVALDIRFGLSEERALRAVTLDAARILGIDDVSGSIDVGKEANLVALSGDPFASTSRVLWTMSSGKVWEDDVTVPIETSPGRKIDNLVLENGNNEALINEKAAQ
jgi:imidazolonepropionase-like amidohydrolase